MHNRRHHAVALFILTLAVAGVAEAGEPAARLTTQIERVFQTLEDPALKAAGREPDRRAAVRRIIDETFDFREASRRALGRHWATLAPDAQARFVRAFTALIDHAYLRRLDQYDGERVVVTSDTVTGDEASVQTTVITRDSQMGVDYQMVRDGDGRWVVYDIKIGGMSLVSNYRSQFNKVIQTGSFDDLMARLEAKVR